MKSARNNYSILTVLNASAKSGHYAGKMQDYTSALSKDYSRRNFYKISLLTVGEGTLYYTDKQERIARYTLVFTNPLIPYSYKSHSLEREQGYFCIFTDQFVNGQLREGQLATSPLFKAGGTHSFTLNEKTAIFLIGIFERLVDETHSEDCKPDLLRSYIQLIMHEALKLDPVTPTSVSDSSKLRLTDLFLKLLESKFGECGSNDELKFRSAQQFAQGLSVHPNHLNRVLKTTTGKSTTQHISERLLTEAKFMLLHDNRNIAEIAYILGFSHASNFLIFFKRHTGRSANSFRKNHAANS